MPFRGGGVFQTEEDIEVSRDAGFLSEGQILNGFKRGYASSGETIRRANTPNKTSVTRVWTHSAESRESAIATVSAARVDFATLLIFVAPDSM